MMDRITRNRLDAAVRGALAAPLKDYARGTLDREALEETARRRANAIRANFHDGRAHAVQIGNCTDCAAQISGDSIVVIDGRHYCVGCAPAHRREPPARRCA